jgi:uncharacterized SAM-binding protein YcdF (DUF218 family)
MFIVGKILSALVLPPGLFIVIAVLSAILAGKGRRKTALVLSAIDALIIYVFSTCAFSNLLVIPLENRYAPLMSDPGATAVVVLGGGYNDTSPEYANVGVLTYSSESRAIYGLELAKRYALPLVFSGGKGYSSRKEGSEAEAAMRLWLSLGIEKSRITLESASLDTKGNAAGVVALSTRGSIVVVTSAFHMPRAMLAFTKAGLHAIPAPTDYMAKRSSLSWADFLPDASRLEVSVLALHEYIGLLYYRLTL